MKRESLRNLVESLGTGYSDVLGIKLRDGAGGDIFKWFLASVLFGAPITETSAIKTYRCFQKRGVLTPMEILEVGWNGLVEILDEGGYTRYDFKTADKLLNVARNLMEDYRGDLNALHEMASDPGDLEDRLKGLSKGIGEVTVSIFLREMRGVWAKARPKPTSHVIVAAKNLGIIVDEEPLNALRQLEAFWAENGLNGKSFVNFETALSRLGKGLCKKRRCTSCLVKSDCSSVKAS